MPDFSPTTVSTFFLACFFIAVMAGIVAIWRFYTPLFKARHEALTRKEQAHAELADSLRVTTQQGIALMSAQADLAKDHGVKLGEVKQTVQSVEEDLREVKSHVSEIRDKVLPGLPCRAMDLVPKESSGAKL